MGDQYIRHDGSDRNDMFICLICNTGSMHEKVLSSHCNGCGHKFSLRHERLKDRARRVDGGTQFTKGKYMHSRINSLGLLSWRQDIKEKLYDYIFDEGEFVFDIPFSIERQLEKYQMLEKTSLLELAVWKASCLSFDGSMNFHTMQDILDQWAMDESFDPAAYKQERRFNGSMAVIMRCVLPFL